MSKRIPAGTRNTAPEQDGGHGIVHAGTGGLESASNWQPEGRPRAPENEIGPRHLPNKVLRRQKENKSPARKKEKFLEFGRATPAQAVRENQEKCIIAVCSPTRYKASREQENAPPAMAEKEAKRNKEQKQVQNGTRTHNHPHPLRDTGKRQ
ncbi:hypothetical protein B0H17DRAFT_1139889 [Mycena rosella]|uniref:Uncharacterized protein n=1 Tax=Mycena rosella TaxID=1033263 RepID=A0AAD7D353_MYCRO|nr:hypothetical protein B0H17DRAFT_1139889 [Mycena rosella]